MKIPHNQQFGRAWLIIAPYFPFPAFKVHPWRQSIVKTIDSDLRIYCFLYWSGRAQYTGLITKLYV